MSEPIRTDKKALLSGARRVFTRPRRDILEATQPSAHSACNSLYNNRLRYFKKLPARVSPTNEDPKEISVLISVYCDPRKV